MKTNNLKNLALVIALSTVALACTKKEAEQNGLKPLSEDQLVELSAQSALNTVRGFSDDTGATQVSSKAEIQSKAICSGLAALQPCVDGTQAIAYDNCQVAFTNASAEGFVQLDYTSNTCSLDDNESVQRTYDMVFTGPFVQAQVTSDEKTDYQGNSFGGGGLLSNLVGDLYQIEILGQHRVYRNLVGRELVNFSLRTVEPVIVAGSFSSDTRVVQSGEIQVSHNIAKSQANYSYTNLAYDNACCHPISGQLEFDISGKLNRSGTIEVTSCGKGILKEDGKPDKELTFNSCD